MAEKLVTLLMVSSIFVRGTMFKAGEKVEVNEREAKELLARGVATDEAEVGIEEDPTIPLERMKRDELLAYAKKLGLEVLETATKAQIIEIINASNEDEE
ncbi:hypothetical protein ACOTV5_02405 [Aliarcobacter butzleri]|uniref:hypothetical protein n=1 Tax=Aliarcobacter butzleri TaxID=28197 RepID=UPI003AFA9220